jgi:hypothetical protein
MKPKTKSPPPRRTVVRVVQATPAEAKRLAAYLGGIVCRSMAAQAPQSGPAFDGVGCA